MGLLKWQLSDKDMNFLPKGLDIMNLAVKSRAVAHIKPVTLCSIGSISPTGWLDTLQLFFHFMICAY